MMDKMGGRDQLMNVLKQNGVSVGQFKKDLRNQIKMQKLCKRSR